MSPPQRKQSVRMRIRAEGTRRMIDNISRTAKALSPEELDEALFTASALFEAAVRERAPVGRTRRLRDSVYRQTSRRSTFRPVSGGSRRRSERVMPGQAVVVAPMFYGRFLEAGTKKMRPRRFVRPAYYARRDAVLRKLQSDINERAQKSWA